jgi:hypothetical protein
MYPRHAAICEEKYSANSTRKSRTLNFLATLFKSKNKINPPASFRNPPPPPPVPSQ